MKDGRLTLVNSYRSIPYRHEPKHPLHVEKNLYTDIRNRCNELFMEQLVTTGLPIELPNKLSYMQIVKRKTDKKPINWPETRKQGKWVHHNNMHTGGFSTKLWWSKRNTNFRNSYMWSFTATRAHKRKTMAAYFKKHGVGHLIEI